MTERERRDLNAILHDVHSPHFDRLAHDWLNVVASSQDQASYQRFLAYMMNTYGIDLVVDAGWRETYH